jgi:hypothetical protein
MSKRTEIQAGLIEWLEGVEEEIREANSCHCCCCTGECTAAFEESTPEEQDAWLEGYWEAVRRGEA